MNVMALAVHLLNTTVLALHVNSLPYECNDTCGPYAEHYGICPTG